MGVTVRNVKIVQCTIFCWNSWTTNWTRRVWSSGAANFGTRCSVLQLWQLLRLPLQSLFSEVAKFIYVQFG